jgi:hypothetical protein
MALTESQIKVIIAAELQKAGFDKADRAAKNLTKTFQKLGATVGVALSARALFNFAKQGAIAFAEEDKAVKQLTNSLGNLGFAFAAPGIERYLTDVENATLVTKEQLRPAILSLVSTTMSAKQGMDLLGVAIDAAAQTGADLGSVTNAITRAYNGNYASLAKLTKGYSSAELEAGGFKSAIAILSSQVSGSAAASVDTFAFKMGKLQKAIGDAQKAVGEGLIKAIEQLGSGNYDEGLQDLVDVGNDIGKAFGYAAGAVNTLKDAYDLITLRFVRDRAIDLLGKTEVPRLGTTTPTQLDLVKESVLKRKEAAARKAELAERKRLAALESAERKKREEALRKEQSLKRAGTVFDMENIQIIAALQGNIDENQRLRLTALLALNTANADAAEKLSQALMMTQAAALQNVGAIVNAKGNVDDLIRQIISAQAQIALVGTKIENLPKGANPFANWDSVLKSIIDGLGSIPAAPNPFSAWDDVIAGIQARIASMKADLANLGTSTNGTTNTNGAAKTLGSMLTSAQKDFFSYNLALGLTNAAFVDSDLPPDVFGVEFADQFAEFRNMIMSQLPNITVNVSGSVISEADLNAQIANAILQYQRSGQVIVWSASP